MNEYDSEKMLSVLEEEHGGIEQVAEPDEADIILFNTCSVREKAQEKVFSDLGRVRPLKDKKPDLIIGVAGCVASQEGEAIVKRAPFVDIVFGPQTLHRLPRLIDDKKQTGLPQVDISFPEIEKFDHLPPAQTSSPNIYFLGAHRQDRIAPIVRFCQHAQQAGWPLNFQIARDGAQNIEQHYPVNNIQFHNGISYQQNLDYARSSRILADFVISTHKGLSLRTFEAIGYRKKLITTNAEVKKYDFYHPSNIFIWDGETLDGLDEFIASPYQEIDPAIREKYSFGNWIRYVLNIRPHQPITLPQP